jgi:hypothetical protein
MTESQAIAFLIRFYDLNDIQALIFRLKDKSKQEGFTAHEINQLSILYSQISAILFPATRF